MTTRYAATYVPEDGLRVLMRSPFDTRERAQAWLEAVTENNSRQTLLDCYGRAPRFEVREVECWPSGDAKGVYFEDEEDTEA